MNSQKSRAISSTTDVFEYEYEKEAQFVYDLFDIGNGRTTLEFMKKMMLRSDLGNNKSDIDDVLKVIQTTLLPDVDGTYSVEEILTKMHVGMDRSTPMHLINESYAAFDRKLSGKITLNDLKQAVEASGSNLDDEEAERLISMYATTLEGKSKKFITRDEFITMIKENLKKKIEI
eukprot:GDKJ01041108.1.p1 GENE.GDKJ01041108.1~~GDKJ01041108.1.p1  ORF type:complete len:175 (+),score=29.83 GDKJ01041108.1:34-558(+)